MGGEGGVVYSLSSKSDELENEKGERGERRRTYPYHSDNGFIPSRVWGTKGDE